MARLVDTVRALVIPDHTLIILLGPPCDDFPDPDFTPDRISYAYPDLLYLCSATTSLHRAEVSIEAWDGRPPVSDSGWEVGEDAELPLSAGEIFVSAMAERAVSPTLRVGAPGRYGVRVDVSGRIAIRLADRDPDRPDMVEGIERFRVRLWPAGGDHDHRSQ
jgi:hypothetical protein